jgi:hypothetical protein
MPVISNFFLSHETMLDEAAEAAATTAAGGCCEGCFAEIAVTLSPFSKILPKIFRDPFFELPFGTTSTSSASSTTRFMYSSKPRIRPSIRVVVCSKSQMHTRVFVDKNLKITARERWKKRKMVVSG